MPGFHSFLIHQNPIYPEFFEEDSYLFHIIEFRIIIALNMEDFALQRFPRPHTTLF